MNNKIAANPNIKMEKALYCQYDENFAIENSVGALRIYLPANIVYINWNIAHCVREEFVCDTWRITRAFAVDDQFQNACELTTTAEWDMALRIKGRDDFIGGYMHGDEKFTAIRLFADDCEKQITSFEELTKFNSLRLQVESVGYDPDDHKTEAVNHFKEYIIDSDGIAIEQKVQWLNDYQVGNCYLAMMPPLKELTDSYYTDAEKTAKKINISGFEAEKCSSATQFGTESKLTYRMSVPKYPGNESGNRFLITDNGGGAYNKMYFFASEGGDVRRGEVWESRTEYSIQKG